jgi:hypothetical protein
MAITSHVLDLSSGRPAAGVDVVLEHVDDKKGWHAVARATTDADGRVKDAFTEAPRPRPLPAHVRDRRLLRGAQRHLLPPRGDRGVRGERRPRASSRAAAVVAVRLLDVSRELIGPHVTRGRDS